MKQYVIQAVNYFYQEAMCLGAFVYQSVCLFSQYEVTFLNFPYGYGLNKGKGDSIPDHFLDTKKSKHSKVPFSMNIAFD